MKRFLTILVFGLLVGGGAFHGLALAEDPAAPPAPAVPGPVFVDEDGDGICDNFANRAAIGVRRGRMGNAMGAGCLVAERDADGDGIPNGQDPDYVRPLNGRGGYQGWGTRNGSGVRPGPAATPGGRQ